MNSENTNPRLAKPVFDPPAGLSAPPIDDLLDRVSSKYALAIFAAKRARQINEHNQQYDETVLDSVGPLVRCEQGEKDLSIALREVASEVLEYEEGK